MYLMPLNFTLKSGENGKFYVICILPEFLKAQVRNNNKAPIHGTPWMDLENSLPPEGHQRQRPRAI